MRRRVEAMEGRLCLLGEAGGAVRVIPSGLILPHVFFQGLRGHSRSCCTCNRFENREPLAGRRMWCQFDSKTFVMLPDKR